MGKYPLRDPAQTFTENRMVISHDDALLWWAFKDGGRKVHELSLRSSNRACQHWFTD